MPAQERAGKPSWLVVSAEELHSFRSRRLLILLWILCLGPQIILLVKMLMAFSVVQLSRGMRMDPQMAERALGRPWSVEFYTQSLLEWSLVPVVVLLAATSILSVSRDRRRGALELYFTRPIRTRHYLQGRWLAAALMIASVTFLPTLAAWLVGVLVAPDWEFLALSWVTALRIFVQGLFFSGVLGLAVVALSSLSPSSRTCQVAWVGFLAVMHMVFSTGLRRYLQESWPVQFSPWGSLQRVSEAILGVARPEHDLPLGNCLLITGLLVAASLAVLWRTLRPLEVVG